MIILLQYLVCKYGTCALSTSLRFVKSDSVEKVSFILEFTTIIQDIKDTPLFRSFPGVSTYTLVI